MTTAPFATHEVLNQSPPFEDINLFTLDRPLVEAVRAAGRLLGQDIGWKPSGGVCEGNNLFAAGLPNVDTLGVRGGDIHSENEYAWPESFLERAQLSALILMKLAAGEIDGPGLRAAMENA